MEYVERCPSDHVRHPGGEARGIACEPGIVPAVLGGAGQVLDLGRKRRFHTEPQRIALGLATAAARRTGATGRQASANAHHAPRGRQAASPTSTTAACAAPTTTRGHATPPTRTTRLPGGKVAFTRRT